MKSKTLRVKTRAKPKPQDGGLDAKTIQRLRTAIRQVWHWTSYARRLCLKRAETGPNSFPVCESCLRVVQKVYADHITPCGNLDEGYIKRTFVSSEHLQALCKKCHDRKTRDERALIAMGIL